MCPMGKTEAIYSSWHRNVAEHQVDDDVALLDDENGLICGRSFEHLEPAFLQIIRQHGPDQSLIINDQNGGGSLIGGRESQLSRLLVVPSFSPLTPSK